jgi:hypothetical protein
LLIRLILAAPRETEYELFVIKDPAPLLPALTIEDKALATGTECAAAPTIAFADAFHSSTREGKKQLKKLRDLSRGLTSISLQPFEHLFGGVDLVP